MPFANLVKSPKLTEPSNYRRDRCSAHMKSPNNEPNSKPAFFGLQQPMDGKKGGLGIAKLTGKSSSENLTIRRIIHYANLVSLQNRQIPSNCHLKSFSHIYDITK